VTEKHLIIEGAWTSEGLARAEAIEQWRRHWAARPLSPIDVTLHDADGFDARWDNYNIGQLRLIRIVAPAQQVINRGGGPGAERSNHWVHFVYPLQGRVEGEIRSRQFKADVGEFVFLDNVSCYRLDMARPHEVLALFMPFNWLKRFIPDPAALLGSTFSMDRGWGPPLGTMLEAIARHIDDCPLPRPMLAEQLGVLLTLAIGSTQAPVHPHGNQLAQQAMRRLELGFSDPDLSPAKLADELGISKRYLQSLLAASGTSFIKELNALRLVRASEMLLDGGDRDLSIGEVAFRCGFLDAGYFSRLFRKRFGMSPKVWRETS